MRRALAAAGVLVLILGALVAAGAGGGSGSGSGGTYRVDAIFDNAGFLIPDQDVKIAGAKVGKVADIHLTSDRKARISMDIDKRFAPFRSDADCTIQPQSLIGEKFIQCTPGTVSGKPLESVGDNPPTIPLSGTHSPVDLDLVLSTFREPTTTRLSLLLDALGNGLAGHGTDLNEALRRANPALEETNKLLAQVNGDRTTIRSLISESDRVLRVLANRREDVAGFVKQAAGVTATTGARQADLRATLRGLPSLLDQTKPALADLQSLAQQGTPVVASLGAAAPATTRLLTRLQPFSRQLRPTLNSLGDAARTGRATVKTAAPQLRRARRLTVPLTPVAQMTSELFQSTQDKGAVEGLLRFVYYATTAQARYDSVSHILPAYPVIKDACSLYALATIKACDAHFATGQTTVARKATPKKKAADKSAKSTPDAAPAAPATPDAPATSTTPEAPAKPATPTLPGVLHELPKTVGGIVDGLLGGLTGKGKGKAAPAAPSSGTPQQPNSVQGLLDYLLGK